jgi:heat shock protein HslJ
MKGTYFIATIFICSLLIACAVIQSNGAGSRNDAKLITPRNLNDIAGIEWNLMKMTKDHQAIALVQDSKTTFACDQDGKVNGKATINRYSGDLKLKDDGEIIWSKAFIMTRMAGPPELMEQEQNFTRALMQTTRMYLKDSQLVLKNQDSSTILEFEPNN